MKFVTEKIENKLIRISDDSGSNLSSLMMPQELIDAIMNSSGFSIVGSDGNRKLFYIVQADSYDSMTNLLDESELAEMSKYD